MTIGPILSRVWQILRVQVRLFLKLGAAPATAALVLYGVFIGGAFARGVLSPHPGNIPAKLPPVMVAEIFAASLVVGVLMFAIYGMYEAAVTITALEANRGGAAPFREALGAVWANAGRVMGILGLRLLCLLLPGLGAALLFGASVAIAAIRAHHGASGPGTLLLTVPLAVLAYVLWIAASVWIMLRMAVAVPACLAEDLSPMDALRRSANLTRNAKGRIFVVMLAIYGCAFASAVALELAVAILGVIAVVAGILLHVPAPVGLAMGMPALMLVMAGFLLLSMMHWAAYGIALAVIYDDQRFREQGLLRLSEEPA